MRVCILLFFPAFALASVDIGANLSILSNKEQTKASSGTSNGITHQTSQTELAAFTSTDILPWLHLGAFGTLEKGARKNCDVVSLVWKADLETVGCTGGDYNQFLIGPLARFKWSYFYIDMGYVAFGRRTDSAYSQLKATNNESDTFHTHPLKAWVFFPGVSVPIYSALSLSLRVEYRYLYFNRRGGESLPKNSLYGNQSLKPMLGLEFIL